MQECLTKEYKLSDFFSDIQNGKPTSGLDKLKAGYPVYGSSNILFFSNGFLFKEDGIIIGRVGENCGCIQIGKAPFWASDNTIVCSVKHEYNLYYIKALLETLNLHKLQNGSGQPLLTANVLKNIKFSLKTSLREMNMLGLKIEKLECLISKNNLIIDILSNKIKDIYSYWFVGNFAQNKFNNGNLFEMVSLPNNKLCSLIPTGINKFEGYKDYFSTSEVKGNSYQSASKFITYSNRESRANMEPRQLSVWFAKMKNSIKHISFGNNSYLQNKIILSTGFAGLECTNISFAYIWSLINANSWFERTKDNIATGSTQKSINENGLSYIKIKCPNYKSLEKYSAIVSPYIDMIEKLNEENEKLKSLKQTLLSYLITQ